MILLPPPPVYLQLDNIFDIENTVGIGVKKLLGGLLLVVSVQGGLWAAACSDKIPLKFSFKEQDHVKTELEFYPLSVIKQFETLKNLLEELGDSDLDSKNAIPVPHATKEQFDLLVKMLTIDDPKNAIPADYNCKQVADLLNLAMLLDNKKIQNALALGLFKKLRAYPKIPTSLKL